MKPSTPDPLEIFAAAVREGAVWFDASEETMRAEIADLEVWRRLTTAAGEHPEDVGEIVLLDDRGQEIRLCNSHYASRLQSRFLRDEQ